MTVHNKVKLPVEAARILDIYIKELGKDQFLLDYLREDSVLYSGDVVAFSRVTLETVLAALVNGYTIEQSPEQKLSMYFNTNKEAWLKADVSTLDESYLAGVKDAVEDTLSILGIQIEGVNM